MYPLPRRTVDDLIARYSLEPSLRDVFVEGASDAKILTQFYKREGCNHVMVAVIDSVEVEDSIMLRHSQSRGEKGELVALASEIDLRIGDTTSFTAVVDADCDRVVAATVDLPTLLFTDFTCMEMYWLDGSVADQFYAWIGESGSTAATAISRVAQAGKSLFAIRAAIVALKLGIPLVAIRRYCTVTAQVIELQSDRYLESVIMAGRMTSRRDEIKTAVSEFQLLLTDDARHGMNGHDFAELVFLSHRDHFTGLGYKDSSGVENLITLMLSTIDLSTYPLFQALRTRC